MHRHPSASYPERPAGLGGCHMPVVPLKDVLDRAFKERYGVAAFNIVNDLTLEAVLAAAVELGAR